MDRVFWAALHDGFIDSADGRVPGTVRLVINIDYVCRELGAGTETLGVVLHDCTTFTYTPYGEPATEDLNQITSLAVELLYAADKGDFLELDCNEGSLRLSYESLDVHLSGGRELVATDVVAAAKQYWDRFREHATRR